MAVSDHGVRAGIDERQVQQQLQPETDLLILDYLLYESIDRLLIDAQDRLDGTPVQTEVADRLMTAVTSFLQVSACTAAAASDETKFRLELWKFVALFTRRNTRDRITPTPEQLRQLRRANSILANAWYDGAGEGLAVLHLEAMLAQETCSLLDLVRAFMNVSAVCSEGFEVTDHWLDLAAEFLRQAVSAYRSDGMMYAAALHEASAWGYRPGGFPIGVEVGQVTNWDDRAGNRFVNAMFKVPEEDRESPRWSSFRKGFRDELKQREGWSDESLAESGRDFELQMISYLESVSKSISKPVLSLFDRVDHGTVLSTDAIRNMIQQQQQHLDHPLQA